MTKHVFEIQVDESERDGLCVARLFKVRCDEAGVRHKAEFAIATGDFPLDAVSSAAIIANNAEFARKRSEMD